MWIYKHYEDGFCVGGHMIKMVLTCAMLNVIHGGGIEKV